MKNVLLIGANGRMGQAIVRALNGSAELSVCAGVDAVPGGAKPYSDFPIYSSLSEFSGHADVIIDFSYHTAIIGILDFAVREKIPAVIATTGHTPEEIAVIEYMASQIPIFRSGNMSLGINMLINLAKRAAAMLGDGFDIEIIERHHNQKLDAPSGTALMIADAIKKSSKPDAEYIYDRHGDRRLRDKKEIGIHSVRGGTIVGEHEVIFAGHDEVITVSHSAASREVFAAGAIRAAGFLIGKPAGLYSMDDLLQ